MDNRVPCPSCGALNRPESTFCPQCYARLDGAAPATAPAGAPTGAPAGAPTGAAVVAGVVAAGHPARGPSSEPTPAVRLPGLPGASGNGAGWAPDTFDDPAPYVANVKAPSAPLPTDGAPQGVFSIQEPARWKWRYLVLFGMVAWVIPEALILLISSKLSLSQFLDASLVIQIVGYLFGIGIAALLVKRVQGGDWGSLGIRLTDASLEDILRGGAFGLILIAIWLPIGFALTRGERAFDQLISTLVGETSGAGILLAGVVVVFGAPVIEEIYYRGMLYAKFARRGAWVAIVGTSLLFVMAHGALIIPPLLLLAFGLGFKRQTKSLWYTIAAHAAWNFVVICLAAYMLLGPAKVFTAADGAYTLRHSSDWQRIGNAEQSFRVGGVDLALEGTLGSAILVARFDKPLGAPDDALAVELLNAMQQPSSGEELNPGTPGPSKRVFEGLPPVFEVTAHVRMEGTETSVHHLAVFPRSSAQVFVFSLFCPDSVCDEVRPDFEDLMSTVRFGG